MEAPRKIRIAATSDVHYSKQSKGLHHDLFDRATAEADVLVICGDLTDYGLAEEAQVLARDIREMVRIPVMAVLGNHDFESGQEDEIRAVMEEAGVKMLDGECAEHFGVGFAGVRGFAGGFDRYALNAWGEMALKAFVQEAVTEALKLETALSRLKTEKRVVILHYAPIRSTVEGEPVEIFPFLGSTRLEDPINHYEATVAFHGHAHKGAPEGATSRGVPVFNVAVPVLRANYPDQPPFRLFEIDIE